MSDEKKDDKRNETDPYDFFKLIGDDDKNKNKKPNNKRGFPFFSIVLIVIAIVTIFQILNAPKDETNIDFSEFRTLIEQKKIVRVEIAENSCLGYGPQVLVENTEDTISNKLFPMFSKSYTKDVYKTSSYILPNFIDFLNEQGVSYKFIIKQTNYFVQLLLSWIIPLGFIALLYFFMFKKMGGGMGGIGSVFGNGGGRSKAVDEGKVKTRFADVAGVDEAKEELMEVVDFLKTPKKYTDIGGKIPKGVLLVGPPGTGKTLLARAVAGEAGVPFYRISGSDFVEMFVGVGASRVRDLFRTAREKAPCIIFIDEIDAIGKSRANSFSSNDEREQTLNQLLVEMDGFDNEKGLIVLAATNRADVLDPALLRPGRFDRQVPVERPDVKGREEILRIHSKNVKLDDDVDFDSLAHGTMGFAGADLANVVNEAALLAVRNGRKKVTMVDFNEAIDKVSIGLKKKNKYENKKESYLVACHEVGHALVGAFIPDFAPVNKITVVPRSHGVGGFTQYREKTEVNFRTKKDMLNEVDSLLGGRAAEELMLGDVSTGASNDIARATDILKRMIVDYGMSEKFKNITLGKGVLGTGSGEPALVREFSEETQNYIDEEIARIMNERYVSVIKLLKGKKDLLECIAKRLLEIETMEGKEFYDIIREKGYGDEIKVFEEGAETEVKKAEEVPAKKTRKASSKKTDSKKSPSKKAKAEE